MRKRLFGVSTRLYSPGRLAREHMLEIGAHHFEAVELFAARTCLDFHNPAAVADLQQWIAEAGLELFSVRVPPDEDAEQALYLARRMPLKVLVVHGTTPRETAKQVNRLAELAAPLDVTVAVDSSSMPPVGSLVHFVESGVEATVGICLDFACAQKAGDLADTIELVSEHLVAARVPVDSAIDWAAAMTTTQKVGYEGPLIFDAEARGPSKDILARARTARGKIERWLTSI